MLVSAMRYLLAGVAAIIFWSMTIPLFKSVCASMDPLCGIGISFSISGAVLSISTLRQIVKSLPAHPPLLLIGAALLFLTYQICLVFAIDGATSNQQALEVGLMNYLWPMMMIVCSLFFFKHQWNGLLPVGMLLSFAGVAYASVTEFNLSEIGIVVNPIPYFLGFVAAFLWGLYSVISRRFGNPRYAAPVALYTLFCGLVFCLWSLLNNTFIISADARFDLILLTTCTGSGYFLWDYAIRKGDLIILASISYFIPLLSILFGAFYLADVELNLSLLFGSIAVVSGAFLCKRSVKTKAAVTAEIPGTNSSDRVIASS